MSKQSVEEEPLRHLSKEEFDLLRASIRQSRRPATPRIATNANKIAQAEYAAGEEGLEIGLKIWKMRKAGKTKGQILRDLDISSTIFDTCLREFEIRMGLEAGRMMEHYRMLDDERIEDMMRYWLPIATGGPIQIEHARNGEVYSEADFDRPLKAGFWVLAAMNMRLKIMMAARPEGAKESQTNVLVWLQQVLPGVSRVVQEVEKTAPGREILLMETEAENH